MAIDTVYTAETPEGIALMLRPAGLMPRSLAYLIDFAIRAGLFLVIATVAGVMGKMGAGLLAIAYFALEWLYPAFFELTRSAATPGKRAMGLRVVMDSGLPVTPAAAFTRNLLRTADFLPLFYGVGLLSMLLRRDGKRLGDLAGGTLVVFVEQVALHAELPAARPQAPRRPLTTPEQAAVVAWAARTGRLTPERSEELARLALPILPQSAADEPAARRLMGVAQWLLGRREPAPSDPGVP